MNKRTGKTVFASVAVVTTLLVGCSNDNNAERDVDRSSSTTNAATGTQSTAANSGTGGVGSQEGSKTVDAARAVEIALAEAPGTVVVEIDQHEDKSTPQWEIVVLDAGKGIEFRIDMATGDVISRESEGLDPEAQQAPAVSAQKMIGLALAATPGELLEADLSTKGGSIVWDVEIRAEDGVRHELHIDAGTGEILRTAVD